MWAESGLRRQVHTLGCVRAAILRWRANKQVSTPNNGALSSCCQLSRCFPDYIWGVVDMVPETDFPDIRNWCAIHSSNGSCMIIPREGDVVRLYIQLTDTDVVDASGRVDKSKMGPQQLIEVANKSFHPYKIAPKDDIDWWTIYISES